LQTRQPTSNRRREPNNNNTPTSGHKSADFYSSMDVDTPVVDTSSTASLSTERQLSQSTAHLAKTIERVRLLELDVERHRGEARVARLGENDARNQLSAATAGERTATKEANTWKCKADQLDAKLQNERRARDHERHTLQTLEKRLVEEQRLRTAADTTLERERRATKKADEARPVGERKVVVECGEACRARRREHETETKHMRRDLRARDEQLGAQERELVELRHYKDGNNMVSARLRFTEHQASRGFGAMRHTLTVQEALMFSLQAFKDKNVHLEKSLRAENSLKQDLFSALGEAKHQIDTYKSELARAPKPPRHTLADELKRKDDDLCRMRASVNGSGHSPVNGHNLSPVITPPPPTVVSLSLGANLFPMVLNGGGGLGDEIKETGAKDEVMLTNAIYNGVAAYM